jgi:hypothetical protein
MTNVRRIQEFVLAKEDPELHLGNVSISWVAFRAYVSGFGNWDVVDEHIARAPELLGCLIQLMQPALVIACLNGLRLSSSSYTLAEILAFTAQFQATDPRDKVYGILGLLQSSDYTNTITVHYSKTMYEVLVDVAKVVMTSQPFVLYCSFALRSLREKDSMQSSSIDGLPSWVVDLTRAPDDLKAAHKYNGPQFFIPTYLRADPKLNPVAHVSADNALHTIGAYIGTIVETSQDLLINSFDSVHDTLFHIYTKILKPRNISMEHLMDTALKYSSASDGKGTDPTMAYIFPRLKGFPPEAESKDIMLRLCIQGRLLFVTSEGHLGFSYVVVGLFSSNFPFVLRKTQSGKNYEMVNIAYVGGHACSHPAIDNAPEGTTEEDVWNDLGKFGVEEYTIV